MLKKRDVILLISVALIAVSLCLIFAMSRQSGHTATVTVNGKETGKYPLKTNTKVDIKSKNGVNRLVIENGSAYIEYADCPNQTCVNHKEISKKGESIICIPHSMVIEIE